MTAALLDAARALASLGTWASDTALAGVSFGAPAALLLLLLLPTLSWWRRRGATPRTAEDRRRHDTPMTADDAPAAAKR